MWDQRELSAYRLADWRAWTSSQTWQVWWTTRSTKDYCWCSYWPPGSGIVCRCRPVDEIRLWVCSLSAESPWSRSSSRHLWAGVSGVCGRSRGRWLGSNGRLRTRFGERLWALYVYFSVICPHLFFFCDFLLKQSKIKKLLALIYN